MIRYHLDQHVTSKIAKALRRRYIDVTTTVEAGLQDADDEDHFAFAQAEQRVIVTNDGGIIGRARQMDHAGICFWDQQTRSIRQVIEMLILIYECYDAGDMRGRIEFL